MIDPLTHGPVLDMLMGAGGGATGGVQAIFADLKRKAEEARAQAQARNPGAQLPPIDYAALMEKATQIAAGTPPEATLEPERVAEARQHMGALMPGETAGMPDHGAGGPGPWARMGRNFQGEEIPADAARRARFSGLTDAGIALLGSASEGNLGRGLAEGLSAFRGGMGRELEGFTARRRQEELDELRRRTTEESLGASREARERARVSAERESTTFEQSQEDRRGVMESMREQLREIEELAGAESPEVERARALLRGGPALQGDLDELHQKLIARKRFPEDRAMETDAELERRKRLFAEDPQARYERGIEERRLGVYERNAGRYGSGGGGDVTATSMLSYLNREAEDQFEILLLEEGGPMALRYFKEGMVPPGVDIKSLRQKAEERAFENLEGLRGKIRGLKGGGGEGDPISEREVAAVRQSLETRNPSEVRAALRERGVPEDKIEELLRRAGVR